MSQKVVCQGRTYLFVGHHGEVQGVGAATVIKQHLFPDDTLATVAEKICTYIPQLSRPVFIWARAEISDPASHAASFALNLLRGRSFVHRHEALAAFANISNGLQLSLPRGRDMMNVMDISTAVPRGWRWFDEPATVKHFHKGYPVYVPIDPSKLTSEQLKALQESVPSTFANLTATLESLGNGYPIELHVVDQKTVMDTLARQSPVLTDRVLQTYFTTQPTLRKQDDRLIYSTLYSGHVKSIKSESYILRLSLVHNEHALSKRLVMTQVLDTIPMNATMPFVFLREGNACMYRVHRRSFSLNGNILGTLPVNTLRSWMEECRKKAPPDESVLVAYVRTDSGTNISIQVSPTQACEIQFRFDSAQSIHRADIARFLNDVNAGIERLRQAGMDTLHPVTEAFLLSQEMGQIMSVRYGAWMSSQRKTPTLETLGAVVRSKLPQLFVVVPQRRGSASNVLTLQFKRYDNYDEGDAIRTFIDGLYMDPPDTWADAVAAAFSLDVAEAKLAVEEWQARSEIVKFGKTVSFGRRVGVYVEVTRSDIGITYTVTGVSGWAQARRIDCAMQHLMSYATGGVPASAHVTDAADANADLLAELRQEIEQPENAGGNNAGWQGIVLKNLRKADEKLFKSGFSGVCTATSRRQPIVLSESEMKATQKLYPGAFTEYVQAGSSPELVKKNFYICPYVWCPKSHIALSKNQFDHLGKRCPLPSVEEKPIIMDSPYFKGQPHHAKLLDASKHPDGLSMPCCFKHNNDPEDKPSYIQTSRYPAPQGRYAVLPASLTKLLAGGPCGNRVRRGSNGARHFCRPAQAASPDGSGHLGNNTKCYARLGMAPSQQPFLECIAHLWKRSQPDVIASVLSNLDMITFLSLDGGEVCRAFMEAATQQRGVSPPFDDFAAWFPKQKDYIERFSLHKVVTKVSKTITDDDDVHREFVWYTSLMAYRMYLEDASVLKTPAMTQDLFKRCMGTGILLFDIQEDDAVILPCGGHDFTNGTFHMLVRKGMTFEPVYRISARATPVNKHHLPVLVAVQAKYCPPSPKVRMASLLSRDPEVLVDQIIDARLRLVAFSMRHGGKSGPVVLVQDARQYGFDPSLPGRVLYAKTIPRWHEMATLDERIATQKEIDDTRSAWQADLEREYRLQDAAVQSLERAIVQSKPLQDKLYYLRHPMNPLSEHQRVEILKDLLAKVVNSGTLKDAAMRRVLLQTTPDLPLRRATKGTSDGTVLLTDTDVADRNPRELFALLKTPYTTADLDVERVVHDVSQKALDMPIHKGHHLPSRHFALDHTWKGPHSWTFRSRLALAIFLSVVVGAVIPGARLPAVDAITMKHVETVCRLFGIGVVLATDTLQKRERVQSVADAWVVFWMDSGMTKARGVLSTRRDELIWTSADIAYDLSPAAQHSGRGRTRVYGKRSPER